MLSHVDPLVIALGTPIILLVAMLAGSLLGRSAGHAIGCAGVLQHSWDLGVYQADAWGMLLGALTGLGIAMLGLVLACAHLST